MKIHFSDTGDHSVGIFPLEADLSTNLTGEDFNEEERERIRKAFGKFVTENFETIGRTHIYFDDECADCLELLKEGKCTNKKCISYYEEVRENEC